MAKPNPYAPYRNKEEMELNRKAGMGTFAKPKVDKPLTNKEAGEYTDRKRNQLGDEQRAAAAAAQQAIEDDPNTPSRRRQAEIAKKSPSGMQRMLDAMSKTWRKR